MFELPPYDARRFYFNFEPFLDADDTILADKTRFSCPVTLDLEVESFNGSEYGTLIKYVGPRDGQDRTFEVTCQVHTEGKLSDTLTLELFVPGSLQTDAGHVWYGMTQLLPQVPAQRSINLDDPYMEMRDCSSGCRPHPEDDYVPHVGESGVEFYYEMRSYSEGTSATARVHGPTHTETFTCKVRDNRISFVSQGCTFSQAGRHRIILEIRSRGGGRRKICRTIHVEDC